MQATKEEEDVLPQGAPEILAGLLHHWQRIAAERPPVSADFPFDDLIPAHPGLGLIEPAITPEGRQDYVYRRVGPEHRRQTGRALEGCYFTDVLYAGSIQRVLRAYGEILASGRPHYWESVNLVHGARPISYVRLVH